MVRQEGLAFYSSSLPLHLFECSFLHFPQNLLEQEFQSVYFDDQEDVVFGLPFQSLETLFQQSSLQKSGQVLRFSFSQRRRSEAHSFLEHPDLLVSVRGILGIAVEVLVQRGAEQTLSSLGVRHLINPANLGSSNRCHSEDLVQS